MRENESNNERNMREITLKGVESNREKELERKIYRERENLNRERRERETHI